jgi:hypothetical protein
MRRSVWDFVGVLTSGAANPAMWVCLALAFSHWRSTFALTLITAWIIAFASFAIRKAIFYRSYGQSASQAETALNICRLAYNLQVCQPIDILNDGDISKTSLSLTSGKVFRLTPKAGNEPLITFKSFLQPENGWSDSVFLLPGSRRVGTAEKFFILHEIGHSSETGHIAQLNAQWAWFRLSIAYGPLFLISGSWACIALVAVLYGLHLLHETKNEILIEADADWNAWTAYCAFRRRADYESCVIDCYAI